MKLPEREITDDCKEDALTGRIGLEGMKNVWNNDKVIYTDEQLLKIREWLYTMASVIIQVSREWENKTPVIPLNTFEDETTKSDLVCESIHRRAGRKRA